MNAKVITGILVLALAVIVSLVCVLLLGTKTKKCAVEKQKPLLQHNDQSLVFADLTTGEITAVVKHLKVHFKGILVDISTAEPHSNCIYSVTLQLPKKQDVLMYLDHGGPKPPREALAVVYLGGYAPPEIKELVVGPLPQPTYARDVTQEKYKGKLPYERRPLISMEYNQVHTHMIAKEFPKASTFMNDILGYDNTDPDYLSALTSAPRGFNSGDRSTWFALFFNTKGSGYYVNPTGLEFLINHRNLNVSKWTVDKVFYNGRFFESLAELEQKYKSGDVKTVRIRMPPPEERISNLKPPNSKVTDIPMQYEPRGPRYSVKNNQVLYKDWSFAFGINLNSGFRLYDIRFKGERIVYELATQEAISIYGSNAPAGIMTKYMDASFGIGRFAFQLIRGIDCPYTATYIDTHHLYDTDQWILNKDSICVFELNSGIPLRRHFSSLGSLYYGGLANTVLVIRTISTLGNYDYIFDFIFYQNGAIETKVHATGYISTSFYMEGGEDFGNRVGPYTLGTIHTHFISYKVDMDIGGPRNTLVTQDMEFEPYDVPWNPNTRIQRTRLTRKVLGTEDQAAFPLHGTMPRYIQFASNQTNKWNHERAYRIQIVSFAGDYLPETSAAHNAMDWAKYKLAVTKYKDEEPFSTSMYNQNDPWTPTVKFSDFINNESIRNEDLVAWIAVGFLHIPHAEDIPNTVTAGNGVGFYLRPYNYFNEDPSVYSPDAVHFQSHDKYNSCSVNPLACVPDTSACAPDLPLFTYNGFDNSLIIL